MKTLIQNAFSTCDFDVIEFHNQIHARIKIRPMYFELGFSPSPRVFGRRIVMNNLIKAINLLPSQYGLLIWDIYRPRFVQKKLFNWMKEEIRKKKPHLSSQENYNEALKYMSPPSNIGDVYCPPHLSGGAVDLTLLDIVNGKEIEMGTPFDDCSEKAHVNYFDAKRNLTSEENEIKNRRDLLRNIMEEVGFVSYQYEWWHFDIGDIFWSRITGHPAVFGPLFGNKEWPEE